MSWPKLFIAVWIAGALAAGCGGSGSSGFDLAPAAEDRNIQTALDTHECVVEYDLNICPADEPVAPAPAQPNDPPLTDVEVSVMAAPLNVAGCANGDRCSLEVRFVADGLPDTAVFQLAYRREGDPAWTLGRAVDASGTEDGLRTDVELDVPEAELQLAVLVYLDGEATTATMVETLYETGADLVFVTRAVSPLDVPGSLDTSA